MVEYRKGPHTVYDIQYHFVWVTKYRYHVLRGPAATDHVFLHRHRPLSPTYCGRRLRTLGAGCGVRVTPHQLRASFARLLLNAGASVLTMQALLGHKNVDTTLRYARVYDGTVAGDYVRAMHRIGWDSDARPKP